MLYDDDPPNRSAPIDDDRLRLIFTCCHPALAMESRVALTLRMVGGLTVPEIARAFLVQESAMGQRITRAKAKIKAARIPYRVPSADDLPARVAGVLAVLYLVFNEGYLATGPDTDPVRRTSPPRRSGSPAWSAPSCPSDGEVAGLLALMLLTEARRPARVSTSGELVALDEQDRAAWDRAADRRGAPAGPRAPGHRAGPGPVPGPRRDQRGAHLRPRRARHRLVAGGRPVRPAGPPRPLAGRRPQPRGRGRRARRPGGGAGGRRPARGGAGRLPRLPRHPRGAAAPAGPQRRSRARRTTGPSRWRATPPRPPT